MGHVTERDILVGRGVEYSTVIWSVKREVASDVAFKVAQGLRGEKS